MKVVIGHWPLPQIAPDLRPGEVHVWCATSDVGPLSQFAGTLASDERARARSFVFVRQQRRWIMGRGLLRALLALYTEESAASLRFECETFGKPRLAAPHGQVRFSFSASHEFFAYALSRDREIGIDVEAIGIGAERLEISSQFCTPDELRSLMSLPPKGRPPAFLQRWTAKEACAKAVGKGVQIPFNSFAAPLDGDQASCTLEGGHLEVVALQPFPGYLGACALLDSGTPSQGSFHEC
jgi:4'-phosphopantetheinyl transferase